MKLLRQIGAVTVMNLKSLPSRTSTSLVIVIGIAGVVAVLISVLAMSTGMIKTLKNSGRDDRVLVLRTGSSAEAASFVTREAARAIAESPGVKQDSEGEPLVSTDGFRMLTMRKKEDGTEVTTPLRGVGPQVAKVRPELKIVEGRMFHSAVNEVIVGKAAHAQFQGLNVGDKVTTRGAAWAVVGIFSTGGDSHESELLTDVETLNSAERRNGYSSLTVMLESPAAFQTFKESVTSNPALSVDVSKEREYYEQQSRNISQVISIIAYVVGGIMAVGAVFSALNTMYSAVSSRMREIATLRAIGFSSTAMVSSVLAEALVLSLLGGLIGAFLAWQFFNGYTVSTSGGNVMGQLIFDLSVSTPLVVTGVVWACAIGLIGGLFPALRAARLPVANALHLM
jgi:putative ABC transport system permease protein